MTWSVVCLCLQCNIVFHRSGVREQFRWLPQVGADAEGQVRRPHRGGQGLQTRLAPKCRRFARPQLLACHPSTNPCPPLVCMLWLCYAICLSLSIFHIFQLVHFHFYIGISRGFMMLFKRPRRSWHLQVPLCHWLGTPREDGLLVCTCKNLGTPIFPSCWLLEPLTCNFLYHSIHLQGYIYFVPMIPNS